MLIFIRDCIFRFPLALLCISNSHPPNRLFPLYFWEPPRVLPCVYKALPMVICYCGFHGPDKLHEILLWAMTIPPLMLPGDPKTWRASDVLLIPPTTRQDSPLLLTALASVNIPFIFQTIRKMLPSGYTLFECPSKLARMPKFYRGKLSAGGNCDETAPSPFPFVLDTVMGSEAEIPTLPLMGFDPIPVPETIQHPRRPWCIEKDVLFRDCSTTLLFWTLVSDTTFSFKNTYFLKSLNSNFTYVIKSKKSKQYKKIQQGKANPSNPEIHFLGLLHLNKLPEVFMHPHEYMIQSF